LSAQAAILAISFGALVLAALFGERRLHESNILERERRLEEALRAGGVMAFDWNVAADRVRYSQNAEQILGLKSSQPFDSGWGKSIRMIVHR
jgi:PAS domain-containing protein